MKMKVAAIIGLSLLLLSCRQEEPPIAFDLSYLSPRHAELFRAAESWWNGQAREKVFDPGAASGDGIAFYADLPAGRLADQGRIEKHTVIRFRTTPFLLDSWPDACFTWAAIHELGHAFLGPAHSPDPDDPMYFRHEC